MSLSAMICNVSRVAAVPGRRAVPRRENAVPIAASLNRFTGVRGTSNAARGTVRVSHVPGTTPRSHRPLELFPKRAADLEHFSFRVMRVGAYAPYPPHAERRSRLISLYAQNTRV